MWTVWFGVRKALSKGRQVLLDSVFPLYCLGCRVEGRTLCFSCVRSVAASSFYCPVCMCPSDTYGARMSCACAASTLDGLFAYTKHHNPLIRRALHSLKYGYIESVGVRLGEALGEAMMQSMVFRGERTASPAAILVPVPLSIRRQRERDFNQAERICEGIAHVVPGSEIRTALLQRTRHTKEQARLSRQERLANVVGVFTVPQPLVATRVYLVDDVATTGATLQECASALKQAGVQEVYAVVVAHG